jgi:hypothetical protein
LDEKGKRLKSAAAHRYCEADETYSKLGLQPLNFIWEGIGSKMMLSQETCLIFANSFGGKDRCDRSVYF